MTARYIVGDVMEVLRTLPDASVDLVFTSPPFLALRSYLPADHELKSKEIGSESTPGEFIDTLLDVTEELARVLAPHGSLCIELGDTYSGSGGAGGDYAPGGMRGDAPKFTGSGLAARGGRADRRADEESGIQQHRIRQGPDGRDKTPGWPLDKSLCLIPESYRWALAYGRNPFTGRETDSWRVRNVVRWCRPNPPVGALGDKVRPATSDIVVACKSRTRYFDLDAVRTEHKEGPPSEATAISRRRALNRSAPGNHTENAEKGIQGNPAGAPPLDHWWIDDVFDQDAWLISTQPYKGAHYATFPQALVVKPLLAMCPERVCRTCGEPSRRITGDPEYVPSATNRGGAMLKDQERVADGVNQWVGPGGASASVIRTAPTLGWTECDCSDDRNPSMGLFGKWRPGVVLDPFAGSGTVLSVASGHGRDSIGIDLDERNAELAQMRVGMFLTVEYPEVVA